MPDLAMLGILLAATLIAIPTAPALWRLLGDFERSPTVADVDDTEDQCNCEDAEEDEPPTMEPPVYAGLPLASDLAAISVVLPPTRSYRVPP